MPKLDRILSSRFPVVEAEQTNESLATSNPAEAIRVLNAYTRRAPEPAANAENCASLATNIALLPRPRLALFVGPRGCGKDRLALRTHL